jgi:hypothetical protein
MANYEARILTRFGDLTVSFDSPAQFDERLRALDVKALTQSIEAHLPDAIPRERRQIKPGLVGVCAFTDTGGLEFHTVPKEKLEAIGIVLYAFDPDAVDLPTLKKLGGTANPTSYLTHPRYAHYFEKAGRGSYRLSHKGKKWVSDDVVPALRESATAVKATA